MTISERQQDILKVIIEDYMKTAEPISSKSICDRLSFSSATIRNEMLELENLKLIEKPHTSAGRVPSDLGYRFYVDNLLQNNENLPIDTNYVGEFMGLKMKELDKIITEACNLISNLTHYTSVVATPMMTKILIRKTDILYVDEKSFVFTLVAGNNIIKTKMLKSDIPLYKEEISLLANALNDLLLGTDVHQITKSKLQVLYGQNHLSFLIDGIIAFISEICNELLTNRVYLGGEENILNYPEYKNATHAKNLIDFIKNPDMLKFAPSDNVNVRIGVENGDNPLSDASVVYATYGIGEGNFGVIGVVGPKRMDYRKVSAYLTLYARQLSKIMENSLLADEDEDNGGFI
ncbi:MAG: heat-inducible transcriptional repressor HrcA [Clostridia bacterium]